MFVFCISSTETDRSGQNANAALRARRHGIRSDKEDGQAALRRRTFATQLQVPQVQRIEVQSVHTVKSTEPK
jgi:hypothetical protein